MKIIEIRLNDNTDTQKTKNLSNKTYLRIKRNYFNVKNIERTFHQDYTKKANMMRITFTGKLRPGAYIRKLLGLEVLK